MLKDCSCFNRMCKHYLGFGGVQHVCRAFPEGIPEEISKGVEEHFTALPGQENSIKYEKASSYAEMEMFKPTRREFQW